MQHEPKGAAKMDKKSATSRPVFFSLYVDADKSQEYQNRTQTPDQVKLVFIANGNHRWKWFIRQFLNSPYHIETILIAYYETTCNYRNSIATKNFSRKLLIWKVYLVYFVCYDMPALSSICLLKSPAKIYAHIVTASDKHFLSAMVYVSNE